MSTKEKEAIQRLIKIAENQQKIIAKLAQITTQTSDVTMAATPYLQQAMQLAGSMGNYQVQSGNLLDDGTLHISVLQPKNYDSEEYHRVREKFKDLVMGKILPSDNGKSTLVQAVNMLGITA